ncbi:MAG: PilZ domain-containing protein [Desulfonauticus sp.]|nr:PilZ domain-containing protein [Desulfonauticus sp.]
MEDKRRRTRVPLRLPAWIYVEGKKIATQTDNISLKGVLFDFKESAVSLTPGECYKIVISSGGGIEVKVVAKFVGYTPIGAAFDFIKMDEISFKNLFNMIRLYAPDADIIEKELIKPAFDPNELKKIQE